MNQYEIARSIYHKLIAKCPQGTYQQQLTKTVQSQFPLRQNYGMAFSDHNDNGGCNNFRCVRTIYTSCLNTAPNTHVRFLNFNTENERHNAWQSYLTKFARFCICMDESTKLAPYMDDYTEPWTDERFKQYFGLTDIEWQLIDMVIKD